jgi:copper transport protein
MVGRVFPMTRRTIFTPAVFAVTVAALLAVVLSTTVAVQAHGILQRSSPRANAVLPAAPDEILLEFNEAVDPRFSEAQVVGPQGERLARGGEVSEDGRRLRLSLAAGQDAASGGGGYVVRWRVLSAVDGHTASGSFIFAVGAQAEVAPAAAPTASDFPPLALILTRWLSYLGALLLTGAVLFDAVVLPRAVRRMDPAVAVAAEGAISAGVRRLRTAAAAVTLAALGVEFVAQAGHVVGGGLGQVLRREVISSLLVHTKIGWGILLRGYAAALLLLGGGPAARILRAAGLVWLVVFTAVVIFLGGPSALGSSHVALIVLVGTVYGLASLLAARIVPTVPDLHVPPWRGASVGAAAVLLAGFTLTSHAAGSHAVLSLFDWLHLLAAAVWVGGLPALLVAVRRAPAEVRTAVGRLLVPLVSTWAALALLVMILTGLAASWTLVASLRGLVSTLYGRSLLVKLALVAGLIALGAVNRFVLRPLIEARREGALERFRVSAAAEAALAAAILLVVGALGIMPPASATVEGPTVESTTGDGILYVGLVAGERVRVRLSPAVAGLNEVTVEGLPASVRLRRLDTLRETAVTPDGSVELQDGWWEVVARGERGQVAFPLIVGAPPSESDPEAVRVLARSRSAMGRVRTWREIEQITDGNGGAVETTFQVVRPSRLRYRTSSGAEAVIIGAVRFSRDPGAPWTRDQLPQPITLDGPYVSYLDGATGVRFGGVDRCPGETCRVVFWSLPSGQAHFAARVGASGRIHRVAMVAPGHYMTSAVDRLDVPVEITPP